MIYHANHITIILCVGVAEQASRAIYRMKGDSRQSLLISFAAANLLCICPYNTFQFASEIVYPGSVRGNSIDIFWNLTAKLDLECQLKAVDYKIS